MKKISTLMCLVALLGLNWQANAADAHVNTADFSFTPQQVTINTGESVTWHWVSGTHPTQSDSNPAAWTTFTLGPNNLTFTKTFTTPGTYPYHCQIHGLSMSGVVVVLAGPTGINENQNKARLFDFYPNPANSQLKIALRNTLSENYEIRVINAIGKTVNGFYADNLTLTSGHETILNIANLPAGLYFVSLVNNDKIMETRRLSIIR